MKQLVTCTVNHQNVAFLTLNRPNKHNAFDNHMITEFIAHIQQLENQTDLRALVISGAGKNFSAGADLNWMRRMASYNREDNIADARQLALLMQKLDHFPRPTLALVNGAAFGGAVGLMATCDSVIASTSAKFSLSEVRIGIIPAVISPYVINKVGHSWGRHLMTSASVFDAQQALQIGLVHQIVALEELAEAGQEWIKQNLNNSPEAVIQIKQLLRQLDQTSPINENNIAQTEALTTQAIANIRASDAGQAGLQAFLNKQPPPWQKE